MSAARGAGAGREIRTFRAEMRVSDAAGGWTLSGYILRYNVLSDDLGGFREKIAPGACRDTAARDDIRALWNHENDLVLGRTTAGTLELTEDARGLAFKVTPPDTTWFRDRMVSLERGDVTGCSFGFYTEEDEWSTASDGTRIRTLKRIRLIEVSPGVTFPAYPQADVALASMRAWLGRHGGGPGAASESVAAASHRHRLRLHELRGLGMGLRIASPASVDLARRRRELHLMALGTARPVRCCTRCSSS